ncbi:MAG TPA: FTR1 family protein, partial [Paracoccaceae bacterium]
LDELRRRIEAKADPAAVKALTDEAQQIVQAGFGIDTTAGGHRVALQVLPDLLDELALVVQSGDYAEAELKRLEAYALFDPDIEQRLVPRAPALALTLEARFWQGSAAAPGLGRLIETRAAPAAIAGEIAAMQAEIARAGALIDTRLSPAGAFSQSLAILLREGLEAVIVLACLIGALRLSGAQGWRAPIIGGVALAVAGSFALWFAAGHLITISTLDRELLEGATALLAALMLIYVTHWVFRKSHVTDWLGLVRDRSGRGVGAGAAFALAFFVVFREGFETVLFYEALLIDAPAGPVLAGLAAGAVATGAVAWAILGLGLRLPVAVFFRATGVLLIGLCVMLVGSGIRGLQTAALVPATPVAWFPDWTVLQLYFGLFPVAEALAAQALVLAVFAAGLFRLRRSEVLAAGPSGRRSPG